MHCYRISTDSQLILSHIFIYPIKSCGYFSAPQWPLNRRGLLYDRQWMVVTETSVALTQKQEPKLCLVHPVVDLQHKVLQLTAQGCNIIIRDILKYILVIFDVRET